MTTHIRRNKQVQARDILLALLKEQEAEAAKHKAAYEGAELRATATRRAIELLDQAMLPLPECICAYNPETGYRRDVLCPRHDPLAALASANTLTDVVVAEAMAEVSTTPPEPSAEWMLRPGNIIEAPPAGMTATTITSPRPHRQRIGKKAQGINDVWNAREMVSEVTVHTALMYARQDACEWCRKGVPFASVTRVAHYVINKDEAGVERGFEYKPCTGIPASQAEGSKQKE